MNIRPENVCSGSGNTVTSVGAGRRRTQCYTCGRAGIRVRVGGALFKHSKVGR